MTVVPPGTVIRRDSLRLWPGVVAVALQWLVRFGAPAVVPGTAGIGALAGILGWLVVVLWWVFLSREPRSERWRAIAWMVFGLAGAYAVNHESMGQLWLISWALPVLSLAFVAWAVVSGWLPERSRRLSMVGVILLASGVSTLLRSQGITGDGAMEFAWRWSETSEERLLARGGDQPTALPVAQAAVQVDTEWPGFRGPGRDGVIPGTRIETDWSRSPPLELWRRPIGPGWSSFAVRGERIYTQEQRGDDEAVSCYDAITGEPVWRHLDVTRFWESQAGVGPRATPTLSGDRVFSLGATGILNALDAGNGAVVWSRSVLSDLDSEVPVWGFAGSPLVVGDQVIVAVSGTLVAYETATGDPRWFGPIGGVSYSSPQLLSIDGVEQVLMPHEAGTTSVSAADGALLWEHPWPGFRIVQPAQTADGDVLIASERNGTRRVSVAKGPEGWNVEERWTSTRLKPYFSDFVAHEGHAYGFDGGILASIDLGEGGRNWKGGRYGQLVLLPDQDLLLVTTEKGELVVVSATPEQFVELARHPAIEGKTWNHPVLVGDLLLVRNSEEMAAFRLPAAAD